MARPFDNLIRWAAISQDRLLLRRLGQAIQRAGCTPILAEKPELPVGVRSVICATAIGALPDLPERARVIAVVPSLTIETATVLLSHPQCHQVIAADASLEITLAAAVRKIARDDLFGVEKYLAPRVPVHLIRLSAYPERASAIDEVLDAAERAGARPSVRAAIAQASEELLMNALYDAPCNGSGERLFANLPSRVRTQRVSPQPVSIRFGATGRTFAIGVRDRYGRFDKPTLVTFLTKCLSGKQIDRKMGGAGLGLYLVANSAAEVAFNVAPRLATEVIAAFDLRARSPLRSIGVYVHESQRQSVRLG